ncbi:NAD(P)-dependent oxidoreductase [Microbacteriaceae bacterium VKM Ac-2854]|nr:NAD(P)-dependent oxidoreductase [Microbacteriaceae bacterium VKM Ac-2854]
MILITGGAGFIGTHTVRALAEAGEVCVLVQRRAPEVPAALADLDVHVVQADVADLDALLAIGERFPITGIVHLAVSVPWAATQDDPIDEVSRALDSFLNVVRAAAAWHVRRIVTASTIGVYGGVTETGALAETIALSMQHLHPIPTFKKIFELLGADLAAATGIEIVNARISGTWGPGGHLPDPFFAAPSLALAAARRTEPDLSGLMAPPSAEDSLDLLYVKDTGRALAALTLAPTLRYATYNVGSGHATSNTDVIGALRLAEPGFDVELPAHGERPSTWLDTARLHEDTGFEPRFGLESAAADYVVWLRDQHGH